MYKLESPKNVAESNGAVRLDQLWNGNSKLNTTPHLPNWNLQIAY